MAIGTIGKYERLDVLGHGTSGVVYLAWDTLLRRQVALKEIRAEGPEMERILDEARVLDRLGRHPHIVQIHSVDRETGAILIDMELIRGANLSDVLRERNGKPLPLSEALRIATAVLDALQYAHERRIIHRDVKPANVLIGWNGMVKLTDFGLAEALGSGSVAGGGGTYPYMAPEDFAEDASSDYQADLWAVGVVLYEMLTARRPFQVAARTKDPFAWKRAIQQDEPARVTALQPELPAALDDVLCRALAKDKRCRYPDAAGFSAALKSAEADAVSTAADGVTAVMAAATGMATAATAELAEDLGSDTAFVFAGGSAIAYTLDELLPMSARFWNESRQALMDGRLERFLRAIGEVYIADLARELRVSGKGDADRRLREFLDRSRGAESEPDGEDVTVSASPVNVAAAVAETSEQAPRSSRHPVPVPAHMGIAHAAHPSLRVPVEVSPTGPPVSPRIERRPIELRTALPQTAPASVAPKNADAGAVHRWWFWPMLLICAGPIAAEVTAAGHPGQSADFQLQMILKGWCASGFLSAALFIVGLGARFPALARIACGLLTAGGLVATGALVSRVLGAHPSPDAQVRAAVLLLFPIAVLLIEAATVERLWRLWAWMTLAVAILVTMWLAR